MDTDLDRLADYEEIMFSDINDNMLIDDSVPDNVRLFTFKETQNRIGKKPGYFISGTKHFYALNGLKRYKQETGEEGDCPKSLEDLILPIRSDPTDPDGDGDKVVDGVDLRPLNYIPNFVNLDLDKDTISWYYDIRMDIIPFEDEHGNVINANNRENTVTKYYYDEYIAPRYDSMTYSEWAQKTYGLSDNEIYLQKSYDQVILGNAYECEITILGTAGSIIVGFSPFGVICDIRYLMIDIERFDSDKGLAQGSEWYLNAIPDFIGIIPIVSDICKGAGESLLPYLKQMPLKLLARLLRPQLIHQVIL